MEVINRLTESEIIVSLSYAEFTAFKSFLELMKCRDAYNIGYIIGTMQRLEIIISDFRDDEK